MRTLIRNWNLKWKWYDGKMNFSGGILMLFEQCQSITSLMNSFNKTWFIAGGWAIDLFLGKETREHKDLEIALFRKDQLNLKEYLKKW